MPAKVEMLIQVCINGRPIWRKGKTMRAELSRMMTDTEYNRVLTAAVGELSAQVDKAKAAEKAKPADQ